MGLKFTRYIQIQKFISANIRESSRQLLNYGGPGNQIFPLHSWYYKNLGYLFALVRSCVLQLIHFFPEIKSIFYLFPNKL